VLSLIIPVYRNEENLPRLFQELEALSAGFRVRVGGGFCRRRQSRQFDTYPEERLPSWPVPSALVELSRNFGSFSAIVAGLRQGTGDYFAVLAADLQEPPELIASFFRLMAGGEVDVVFGHARIAPIRGGPNFCPLLLGPLPPLAVKELPKGGVDVFGVRSRCGTACWNSGKRNHHLNRPAGLAGFSPRASFPPTAGARERPRAQWTFGSKFRTHVDSLFTSPTWPIRLCDIGRNRNHGSRWLRRWSRRGLAARLTFGCSAIRP